jgi:hypothetical protein
MNLARRLLVRFRVEQVFLTDDEGRVIPSSGRSPLFHLVDAPSVDELLHLFLDEQGGEIVGEILRFPGFQAVATVRSDQSVYTLQILPTTDRRANPS